MRLFFVCVFGVLNAALAAELFPPAEMSWRQMVWIFCSFVTFAIAADAVAEDLGI